MSSNPRPSASNQFEELARERKARKLAKALHETLIAQTLKATDEDWKAIARSTGYPEPGAETRARVIEILNEWQPS
jgi:hypothetical protein